MAPSGTRVSTNCLQHRFTHDVHPALFAGAEGNRVADEHLLMPVRERCIRRVRAYRAIRHIRVYGAEERCECVGEAFDVAGRQRRCLSTRSGHQRSVACKRLVRPAAVAQPQLVGLLAVPTRGTGTAVDLVLEAVLVPGADLTDGHLTTRAI